MAQFRYYRAACIISCSLLLACSRIPFSDPALDYPGAVSLLPGECLLDNNLTCIYSNSAGDGRYFRFSFSLNVDTEYEVVEQGQNHFGVFPLRHRHRPSASVFQQFGADAEKVEEQYDLVWNSLSYSQTTIFCKSGMTLVADKEFAGIPAGENLAGLLESEASTRAGESPSFINIRPFEDSAYKMLLLVPTNTITKYGASNNIDDYSASELELIKVEKMALVSFRIPADNCEFIKEKVSFTLEIPIKAAQYLNWLYDSLLGGEVQMEWKDDVLTCRFQSEVLLQKKTISGKDLLFNHE